MFVLAARRLARDGLTCAEIVRALQPLTATVGRPAPSYSAVRRIAAEARRSELPNPYVDEILTKLITGRMPDLYRAELLQALRARSAVDAGS